MSLFARAPRKDLPEAPDKTKLALEAALRVSEIASSGVPLPDAVQVMVSSAIELLTAEQGSIMLLEEDGQTLTLVASYGLPTQVPIGDSIRVGESVAGRVMATGKPLLLNEVDKEEFFNFIPKERSIASSIVVPLRVQGAAIGVLNLAVGADNRSTFVEDDLRVAQMFADQAAGIIYRARLHEQAEQRSSDLMAFVESSRALLGALALDPLLQSVLDGAARLAGSAEGFVCLFDAETGAITRGVFRGFDRDTIRRLLDSQAVKGAVDASDVAMFEDAGGSIVVAGVRTSQGTRGAVVLRAEVDLIADRRHLFRAFAQQCGTALGAAELYHEVERKEIELSSIIQGVPNPIVLVDPRGRLVAINSAAEQVFGVSGQFAAGASVGTTIPHDGVRRLLDGEGDTQGDVLAGNPPKTYKARVADVNVPGAPMGRVLIMDDVTTEREIVQTQRDFVAMIGHELRTPLTIIKGFARTLLKRVEKGRVGPEDMNEGLRTIDVRAAQLERLIEDLLYVSKIESREASLRLENVAIQPLVQRVAEELVGEYPEREVALEIARDLQWPCDETKVGLILRHLLDNALKYSADATGVVVVRAMEDDDELRVDVIDRGIGIVSSDIPHIFERFRQVDGSSTREHGGTGVGLYLCAQLIRVHHGRIWVDSTWGKGSTFSFALPRRNVASDVVRIRSRSSDTQAS